MSYIWSEIVLMFLINGQHKIKFITLYYQTIPTFRSQASIVSEKSTVFTFSYRKAYVAKFDFVVKYVKVTPGSSFI